MGHSAKFVLTFFFSYFFLPSVLDLSIRQSFFSFFLLFLFQKKDFIFVCGVYFFNTRQITSLLSVFVLTLGKTSCLSSVFSAALGKELVRRVPEGIHSAKIKTLGKFEDFGSACF